MKLFLDANIFIAAVGSETGGSRYLFFVAEQDETVHLMTSEYALEEARRNIKNKMNNKYPLFSSFITSGIFTVVEAPPAKLIEKCKRYINEKDAPILAAACFSHADMLCTLDAEDFFTAKVKAWTKKTDIQVLRPGEFLNIWRKEAY